jgi:hypothetical protein
MPNLTVPRGPDDPIRQRPIDTPRVRNAFSAENFGGGPARAAAFREAQGISQDGAQIVEEARKRQFILRMDEEKRAIDEWELSTLHDPEKGAVAKKGRDVFGLDKQVIEQFDQFTQDRESGLSTDEERMAFRQAIGQRRGHVQGWLKDHIGRQMKVYEAQEFEAGTENAKRMGSLSEQEAAKQLPYLRGLLLTQAKAQGWGPEITSKVLRDQESDLHIRVIRRKIDAEDYAGAQTYFDANRGRMLDEDAQAIERPLKIGIRNRSALEHADQIMNSGEIEAVDLGAGKRVRKEVTLEEAIEKTKEIEDLELRKQTQHELIRINSVRKAAQEDQREADVEAAFSAVERREKVPVDVLARLGVTDRQRILSLEREILKAQDRVSDENILLAFHEQTPEQMASLRSSDLLFLREKLSKKDYEQAKELVLSSKRDANKPNTSALSVTDKNSMLDGAGLTLDIQTGKTAKKGVEAMNKAKKIARAAALVEFSSAVASSGKRFTSEEQQAIFRGIAERKSQSLLREVITNKQTVPLFGSDTTKRIGDLDQKDFEDNDWSITGEDKKRIERVSGSVANWKSLPESQRTIRMNMAAVAVAQDQSDEFLSQVLDGTRTWPW